MVIVDILSPVIHRRFRRESGKIFLRRGIAVVRSGAAHELTHCGHAAVFRICGQILPDLLLYEDVVVKPRVPVEDRHKSGNLRSCAEHDTAYNAETGRPYFHYPCRFPHRQKNLRSGYGPLPYPGCKSAPQPRTEKYYCPSGSVRETLQQRYPLPRRCAH